MKVSSSVLLSAKVVGYSILVGTDSDFALSRLASFAEIVKACLARHKGELLELGDKRILALLPSAPDGLICAVDLQLRSRQLGADFPEGQRISLRIGLHSSDRVDLSEERGLAAELRELAGRDSVCVSGELYERLAAEPGAGTSGLSWETVEGGAELGTAYRLSSLPASIPTFGSDKQVRLGFWRWIGLAGAALGLLAAGIAAYSVSELRPYAPDKPIVAVGSFAPEGDGAATGQIAEALTGGLIADLSLISGLTLVAGPADLTDPTRAEGLPIDYFLRGSVQQVADDIRITIQLVDARTERRIWIRRFDGLVSEIFELEDDLSDAVLSALEIDLIGTERTRPPVRETKSVEAYAAFLQGWTYYRHFTPENLAHAVGYFLEAINLDVGYARAHAALALSYWRATQWGWHGFLGLSWDEAAQRADAHLNAAITGPTSLSHQLSAEWYFVKKDYDSGLAAASRAIELNPNDPYSQLALAYTQVFSGSPHAALTSVRQAFQLEPRSPSYFLWLLGLAYFGMEAFEEAARAFEQALVNKPIDFGPAAPLLASYGYLDKREEACGIMDIYRRAWPNSFPMDFDQLEYFMPYRDAADRERLYRGLRSVWMSPCGTQMREESNR